MVAVVAALAFAAPIPVEITTTETGYGLVRGGEAFPLRGAGGGEGLAELAAAGGTTIRTWGVGDETESFLDEAHALGLGVSVGIWLGHERHGFDYGDAEQVAEQRRVVLEAVERLKDHPAVLLWGLGNEMEGFEGGDDPQIWSAVCDLAEAIQERDPHHPVMSTTADIGGGRVAGIMGCDAIDIHGINSYGGAPSIPERYAAAGGTKPIVLTEYGPPGTWEIGRTDFGAVEELTSTAKAAHYDRVTRETFAHPQVMGGYAFLWGWKVEATSTWYGLFLPDGTRLAGVEALRAAWGGPPPENHVPVVTPLEVSATTPEPRSVVTVSWTVTDPDGDPVQTTWTLRREASTYITGGDAQAMPVAIPDAIRSVSTERAELKMPSFPGVYRVYAEARDGHGGGAVASVPLLVGELPPPDAPVPMPWPVYADGGGGGPWAPSGYMGNVESIAMDPAWTKGCDTPPTCLRVDYRDPGGWAGVAWQNPVNDWGDEPGGYDLSSAKRLVFRVRGHMGAERVAFGVGLIGDDKPYPDSLEAEKKVTLTKEWQTVRIPLRGDASSVKTGFRWVLGGHGRPVTFYLDDVRFE